MGEMRDSDWSRENLLRSDWLVLQGATITTAVLVVVAAVLALKARYRCDLEFLLRWQRDVTLLLSVNILV